MAFQIGVKLIDSNYLFLREQLKWTIQLHSIVNNTRITYTVIKIQS